MMDMAETTQLVKSVSIENLLSQRDGLIKRIRQTHEILLEAQELAEASGITDSKRYYNFDRIIGGKDHYHRATLLQPEDIEAIINRVDAGAWDYLMKQSGMWTLMDAKARSEWHSKIEKCETPPLTEDNITATFQTLHWARADMFDRGVIECFRSLSWCYKTNQPFKFGKRLVIRCLRNNCWGPGTSLGHPNSRVADSLDDLVRVLSVLDGKSEPDHRNGVYSLMHINDKPREKIEHEYMSIAQFRNGNGHITFKRLDLVEKMNCILAKHYPAALPYDQHTEASA